MYIWANLTMHNYIIMSLKFVSCMSFFQVVKICSKNQTKEENEGVGTSNTSGDLSILPDMPSQLYSYMFKQSLISCLCK